jgi:hypothetical protein
MDVVISSDLSFFVEGSAAVYFEHEAPLELFIKGGLDKTSVKIGMGMLGTWKNPFGIDFLEVSDLTLLVGLDTVTLCPSNLLILINI